MTHESAMRRVRKLEHLARVQRTAPDHLLELTRRLPRDPVGALGFLRGLEAEHAIASAISERQWPDVASVELVPRGDPRDGRGIDVEVHLQDGAVVPVQVKAAHTRGGLSRYYQDGIIVLFASDDTLASMLKLRTWIDTRRWQIRMLPPTTPPSPEAPCPTTVRPNP